ncbi:MAG: beta-lactamase family protein [Acidobacteriota bacterium]|nr:beta-lactamase family protein [Acidobacteriota bacterium]
MKLAARIVLFSLAAFCVFPAPATPAPAPTIPDTPEGRNIAALLAALAKPEPAALREFITAHFAASALEQTPVEARVERFKGMAANIGPLELVRVVAAESGRAEFVARAKQSGDVMTITLDLDAAAERKIRGIRVEAGQGGADQSREPAEAPKRSDADVAAAAGDWLAGLSGKDEFSGVVLLARKGVPFFQRAYGLADRERKIANTTETRFNVGSIGKAFTSAAIARLVREGRLTYTDTIRKVFPDSKIPSADRITVRQLLDMTSGLGDIFGPEFAANPHRLRELSDYLTVFETKPLKFEPGAGREYSNAGYIVLGLMIEKITGRKYRDVVAESVFGPAGMTETGLFAIDEPTPRRAVGYTRRSETRSHEEAREKRGAAEASAARRPNTDMSPGRGSSAGGSYSTAGDLLKFANALAGGKIALATQNGAGGNLGIAGGAPGCNAILEADTEKGYTIVVLVNDDPPLAERTGRKLREWMPR